MVAKVLLQWPVARITGSGSWPRSSRCINYPRDGCCELPSGRLTAGCNCSSLTLADELSVQSASEQLSD